MKTVYDFIERMTPKAIKVQREFRIPAAASISQAALETGWGRSVKGNNYFGIKGTGQTFTTHEVIDGKRVQIKDSFRAYGSMEESFRDYGIFLNANPRYKRCFEYSHDPKRFAEELQAAGYATDPDYASKVYQIIRRWDLLAIGKEAPAEEGVLEKLKVLSYLHGIDPNPLRSLDDVLGEYIEQLPDWLEQYRSIVVLYLKGENEVARNIVR